MKSFQLFISYSHKDEDFRQELDKWLVNLKDKGFIDEWYDGKLVGGDNFMEKISRKLEEADIVLLLLSQNYLASNSCKDEMDYAICNSNKKRVIPIILKDCTWLDTDCRNLIAFPKDGKSITSWDTHEKAWLSVYEGIKKVIEEMNLNFEFKEEFLNELQQVEFVTTNKEKVTLDDIFIFPNLTKNKIAFENESIDIDYFLGNKNSSILIKGREYSGKTALTRWLLIKLKNEFSPIFLDGNFLYKTINFDDHIKKEFSKQMHGDYDKWKELDNKIAIIDNYHHRLSTNLKDYLADNFTMTIIAMDDEEYMLYFKDEPNMAEYSIISLGQFTLVQQEGLIRKWLNLCLPLGKNEVDDLDIDKIEARVNNIITVNRIVPRYPFFILSILQSFEAFLPKDYQITAYGHCYQALVTAQLIKKNIKYDDIDSSFNYLKNLSFDIYNNNKGGLLYTEKTYNEFRKQYQTKYIISDALINKIENDDYPILNLKSDYINFEYSYIYYFFLGMYIAASENEKIVGELCEKIHMRENAFILIFTIHHTQNRKLLDTILLQCVYSFEKTPVAELSTSETKFMNELISKLPLSIISNKDTSKNRIEQRNRKEIEQNKQAEEEIENVNEEDITIVEIERGLKIIDVLGQILKNRAGSFEKRDVLEILENTIDLGLRILNLFLSEYRKPEFEEWLKKMLQDAEEDFEETKNRKFDDEKRKLFVQKTIQLFGYVVTIGMLNRISDSINTEKLITSLAMVTENKMTPAYEMIDFLVSSSQNGIDVNNVKALVEKYNKSKNYWAEKTISYYVQNFINTHNLKFQDRQKISSILNIKYLPNKPLI